MKKINVNVGKGYDIIFERGILDYCGGYIRQITNSKKVCVISDTNVYPIYKDKIIPSLEKNNFNIYEYIYKAGEESKKLSTVEDILGYLAENGFTRSDLIIALGGGVCGDMAGFTAAIYLRGIDYVQIPTSLLAQVDSSVGGKTAVNLEHGKNLCGSFHQPRLVLIDADTLKTLSPEVYSEGMAEALKMGCIFDESLFRKIETQENDEYIEDIIFQSVKLKAIVVEHDEKEAGERALLNFGHTIGHAIEKLHNFKDVLHGEAVGMGMVLISQIGEKNGITKIGTANRIEEVLKKYNLRTKDTNSLPDLIKAMKYDKKRSQDSIKLILLNEIGDGFIKTVDNKDIPIFFGIE